MATNIPPHNLTRGLHGARQDDRRRPRDARARSSATTSRARTFRPAARSSTRPRRSSEIYKTGSGTVRVRGTWQEGPETRGGKTIYITSIPYAVNKATLVERIADVASSRKLPHLVDVKDLSTDDVRIALELKRDADERLVMAYLYKHTPLQSNFPVNLTCLFRRRTPEVGKPERLGLHEILWHFLHFRFDVVARAARARARGARAAHPHPRGLREGLRRARRDPEDRPQVRGQGRRGRRRSWRASRSTPSRPTRSSSSSSTGWRGSRSS